MYPFLDETANFEQGNQIAVESEGLEDASASKSYVEKNGCQGKDQQVAKSKRGDIGIRSSSSDGSNSALLRSFPRR